MRSFSISPAPGITDLRLQIIVVAVLSFLVFAGTIANDFVWDDPLLIDHVKKAVSEEGIVELFTTSFHVKTAQSARYYRPVMRASLIGDLYLGGGAPWFSHLTNVLIHCFNAVLVLLLFRQILGNNSGAFAGSLLFAVHPVHTEAVAAVFSRMDLLALLLLLPAALNWTKPEDSHYSRISPVRYLAPLSYFLACLTKETSFMLLPVLLVWVVLEWKRPAKSKVVSFIWLTIAAFTALIIRMAVFAREAGAGSIPGVRAGAMLPDIDPLRILKILVVNMRLAITPFPDRSYWSGWDLTLTWTTVLTAVCFLLFLGWAFRRSPGFTVKGLIWWAVFTLPVVGIFHLGQVVAAERYAYIPSVGFCLMAGGIVASMSEKILSRSVWKVLVASGLTALACWSVYHSVLWKNEIVLYGHVLKNNPSYANIHVNFGAALVREGRYQEALESYEKAELLVPGWAMVSFNRGNLLYKTGNYEKALEDFNSVLRIDPGDWEAALNKGNVLTALDRTEEAAMAYHRAAANSELSGKPLVGLGLLSAGDGRYEEAVRYFREAADREPSLSEAFEGMGEAYIELGKHNPAVNAFLRAIEVSPGNTRAAVKLGDLLMSLGQPLQAIQAFRTALAADPSFLPAWKGFVLASDAAGKGLEAERYIRDVARQDVELAGRIRQAVGKPSP
jgi:tetratricopeptide (TPR) repeat protein